VKSKQTNRGRGGKDALAEGERRNERQWLLFLVIGWGEAAKGKGVEKKREE